MWKSVSKLQQGDPNPDVTTPANSGQLIIPWKNQIKWPEGYVFPMGLTVTQHPTHSPAITTEQLTSSVRKTAWKTVTTFQKHAPYGIPKEKGGDNANNVERMERCVNKLMEEGHDKSSAIAICKKSLGFTKPKRKKKSSWRSVKSSNGLDWDDDWWDDWEDWGNDWDDEDDDNIEDDDSDLSNPPQPSPTVIEPSGYNEKDDPLIAFVNASTLLSDKEVELIQKACQKQVDDDYGPFWHIGMRSVFVPKGEVASLNAWSIFFLDKPTISGALGYQDFINGQPVAYVFITTSQQSNVSVSSVASHEALEMLSDPLINTTAQVSYQTFYALESCDAVQQSSYNVTVELDGMSYPIEVSNFVTPDWFRTETSGPWDFLRKLNGPLELLPNGSYIGMWTPKTGWVQKNAYGQVEPLEEDDKRYIGDEAATTIYHAPQEPQRCLRPFQRRQMDKPLQVTSAWHMVAMPVNPDFLSKIEWQHESSDTDHRLNAFHPDHPTRIGAIEWSAESGKITGIGVHPDVRRRGLATALYKKALSIDPRLYHSLAVTEDGFNWIKSLDDPGSLESAQTLPLFTRYPSEKNEESKRYLEDKKREVNAKWKSVTAMSKNPIFLNDVKLEHKNNGTDHMLEAYHPEGGSERVALLTWDHDKKLVDFVYTKPPYQRQGLATLLWNKALEITPGLQHQTPRTLTNSGEQWIESLTNNEKQKEASMINFKWKSVTGNEQTSLFEEPKQNEDPYKLSKFFDFRVYPTKKDLLPNECDNDMMTCEHGSKVAPGHKMLLAIGKEGTYFGGKKYRFHHGGECQQNGTQKLRNMIYSVYGPDPE